MPEQFAQELGLQKRLPAGEGHAAAALFIKETLLQKLFQNLFHRVISARYLPCQRRAAVIAIRATGPARPASRLMDTRLEALTASNTFGLTQENFTLRKSSPDYGTSDIAADSP